MHIQQLPQQAETQQVCQLFSDTFWQKSVEKSVWWEMPVITQLPGKLVIGEMLKSALAAAAATEQANTSCQLWRLAFLYQESLLAFFTPSCEHASKQTHCVSFGDFHLYTKSCEHANFINGITIQMPYYDAAIKQKTQNRLPKANHCLHLPHHQSVFRRGKAIIGNAQ